MEVLPLGMGLIYFLGCWLVPVITDFSYWLLLKYERAPDPLRGSRGGWPCRLLVVCLSSSCTATSARTTATLCTVPNCTARSLKFNGLLSTELPATTEGG